MILIAESGSTKTDWVFCGANYVHRFSTDGINPYFINADNISLKLKPIFQAELSEIPTQVNFYGTGITDETKSEIIKNGISKALETKPEINTYSDVVAAARALFGNDKGIACILGTGSNSCYWNGSLISHQVPPLGFWLGDEGSGGHMGKTLVLDYLHQNMDAEIRTKFIETFGNLNRLDILPKAYQESAPNKYFAGYTHFIRENIEHKYIAQLVKKSFTLFFDLYISKYPQAMDAVLGCVGSIAHVFEKQLKDCALDYGFESLKIVHKPIDELVKFHNMA